MPDDTPAPPRSSTAKPPQNATSRFSHATLLDVLAHVEADPSALHAIVDASLEALVAFDANRRILHANRSAEGLFGYATGALDGLLTDEIVPERLRQPQAPPMVPVADVMQVDLPGLRGDGTEFAVEWAFASVLRPEGAVFVMTVRDRAAIDRGIEELRASEERFRLLVEGVHEYAMFMLDANGSVSSWNKGAERIKRWSTAEIVGQSYEVFFTADDRAAGVPTRVLADAVRMGSAEVLGWRMRKDGTSFRARAHLFALRSATGSLRGFAKITRDLTETLQAEDLERRLVIERAGREPPRPPSAACARAKSASGDCSA